MSIKPSFLNLTPAAPVPAVASILSGSVNLFRGGRASFIVSIAFPIKPWSGSSSPPPTLGKIGPKGFVAAKAT